MSEEWSEGKEVEGRMERKKKKRVRRTGRGGKRGREEEGNKEGERNEEGRTGGEISLTHSRHDTNKSRNGHY